VTDLPKKRVEQNAGTELPERVVGLEGCGPDLIRATFSRALRASRRKIAHDERRLRDRMLCATRRTRPGEER
jgi:hypothetical protein